MKPVYFTILAGWSIWLQTFSQAPESDRAKTATIAVKSFAAIELVDVELKVKNLREAWISVSAMLQKMYPALPPMKCRFEPEDDALWVNVPIHEIRKKVMFSALLADMASAAGARAIFESDRVVFQKVDEPGVRVEGRIYLFDDAWKGVFSNPVKLNADTIVNGLKRYGIKLSLIEEIDESTGVIVLFAARSELDKLDSLIELARIGALRSVHELDLKGDNP